MLRLSSSIADHEIAVEEAKCCMRDAESLRGLLGAAEERSLKLEGDIKVVSGERDALLMSVSEARAQSEALERELGRLGAGWTRF